MSGPTNFRERFFANVRAHVVSRLVQGVVGIALVPYVLSHLSKEEYGLWSWLLAISSWLTVADLGLVYGNVNPLARSLAAKDERRVGEILVAALGLHALLTLLIVAVIAVAREPMMTALPAAERALGGRALVLLAVAQAIVVLSFPFGALLSALQRLDLVHKVQTVQLMLQAVATVAILENGGRVLELAWMQLGLGAFQLAARVSLGRRLHPSLRLARPPARELPTLVLTGLPIVVLGIAGTIVLGFERTFLGFVVELGLVAQYAVAARLVMTSREVPQVLLSALVPASAALDVAGDDRALARLYERSFRIAVAVVLALVAALAVAGPAALAAWLGPGFEAAGSLVTPLAIALLVPLVAAPGVHVLTGGSRLGRVTPVYAAWSVVFVIVNALWLSAVGFAGAGWGAAVVNLAGTGALLVWMHGDGGLPAEGIARALGRGVAAAVAAFVAGEAAVRLLTGAIGREARLEALAVAVCGVAVVGTIHLAAAWWLGLIGEPDRRQLADALGIR